MRNMDSVNERIQNRIMRITSVSAVVSLMQQISILFGLVLAIYACWHFVGKYW